MYRYGSKRRIDGHPHTPGPDDEVFYRFSDPTSEDSPVLLEQFRVHRRTPKGVMLDVYGWEQFVLTSGRKRFAYPTKEEAWLGYCKRKERAVAWTASAHDRQARFLERTKDGMEAMLRYADGTKDDYWPYTDTPSGF
jgi:hypothetical protein